MKMDLWTGVHKNVPFVDKKNYAAMCFTCFFVPKIAEQRYAKDGSLEDEVELPYSCENLSTPKELLDSGAAESLRQAKASAEGVAAACKGIRQDKKPAKRPEPSWNIA